MGKFVSIPDHIQQLNTYKPGPTKVQLLEQLGVERIVSLWNNENPLGVSPKAEQALKNATQNLHFYPDPGSTDLCGKIEKHLGLDNDTVAVGNGGESLMMLMLHAFCQPDDEILTSDGSFVIMYLWAAIKNLQLVKVPIDEGYGFDLNAMYKSISDKTKIIYIANANNPTGSAVNKNELLEFIQKVPEHILIMVDEAYFEFSKHINPDFPDSTKWGFENVLTLRSFSKCYGLAGLRIGYIAGPQRLIAALKKVKLTFEPGYLAQIAGIAALDDKAFLFDTVQNNSKGLEVYYKALSALNVSFVKSYANFVMIDLQTVQKAEETFNALYQRGILVRKLHGSGLSHCLRISVGSTDDNFIAIEALGKILQS